MTSPLKVQWARIVSSGEFGLAENTKPKDASRSWARRVPCALGCFSRAKDQNRSPGYTPPYSLGTLGLRCPLGARAQGGCQTPVQSPSSETRRRAESMSPPRLLRLPFCNTGLLQGLRVPWSSGIPTPAHHRRRVWKRGRQPQVGGAHLLKIRAPRAHWGRGAGAGHTVGSRALLLPGTRLCARVGVSSTPDPGTAPPGGKLGGKVGPRLGNAHCRPAPSPPPTGRRQVLRARLTGGRDSQVEARRPAGPAAARACPVPCLPQGPRDNEGRAALRDPGCWRKVGGGRSKGECTVFPTQVD